MEWSKFPKRPVYEVETSQTVSNVKHNINSINILIIRDPMLGGL
jgi:hypothetical protein